MRSHDQRATTPVTSTRAAYSLRARFFSAAGAVALSAALGACSVSYPIYGSDEITTGSIGAPKGAVVSSPLAPPPGTAAPQAAPAKAVAYAVQKPAEAPAITPSDWAYARGALSLAMGADALNASVPWANPDTGSYGAFSATAGATSENGATCRAFSASHSGGGREQRLEGTACRTAAGYWEAVALKATASRTL